MRSFAQRIRRYYFRLFQASGVNRSYVRTPAIFESIVSADPAKLFIFVVAFNEAHLIALHWKALERFCRDEHEYFVIDNSNQPEASKAIRQFCEEHRVNYVRLPKNPALDGSFSHGFALNWAYHNLVAKFHPRLFGIIDSDLFPTKFFSIGFYLGKGDAWGILMERHSTVALWPGFAFFKREWLENQNSSSDEPNFLPGRGVDTGGRVKVDGAAIKKLPEVYDLDNGYVDMTEIKVPRGVASARRYGSFVHLTGASWIGGSADAKLRWIEMELE
jgi:hypothetical protein